MSSIKKISIIALVLLLIGVAGSLFTYRNANKLVQVSEEKLINDQNITQVQVETDNVGVEIVPTKDKVTKIELSGKRSTETKQIFSANVNGTTLSIKLKDERLKFFSLDFLATSLTLKVYLPEKQYASLLIDSQNGLIQAQQMNITDVKATTNNGRIELKNIVSSTVYVESSNGKISLEHVDGKLTGKTNNGKISIISKDLDRPMQLDTNNGSISVQTEKEPTNTTFNVHVDNGHINILDKYNSNAVIGKGENVISLITNNGAITVSK